MGAALGFSSNSLNNSALALTSPVSSPELHQNFLVLQAPLLQKEFSECLWYPGQLIDVFLPTPAHPEACAGKYSFLQLVK